MLGARRRRQLAARHRAFEAMTAGARSTTWRARSCASTGSSRSRQSSRRARLPRRRRARSRAGPRARVPRVAPAGPCTPRRASAGRGRSRPGQVAASAAAALSRLLLRKAHVLGRGRVAELLDALARVARRGTAGSVWLHTARQNPPSAPKSAQNVAPRREPKGSSADTRACTGRPGTASRTCPASPS